MKKVGWLAFMGFLLCSISSQAQTADEVVNKYIAANGGLEKLQSLKSVRTTASISVQGMDIPITITQLNNKGYRLDMEIMGASNYQLANEKEGWIFMPVQGMNEPQKMDDNMFAATKGRLDIGGSLVDYKEKGNKVELQGTEKVSGSEAYKLKVTKPDGKTSLMYIDAKTYRLVKTVSNTPVNGQDMEIETSFSDYKQNADGYWFAYSIGTMQGTIVVDKIETNVPVDESIFRN